MSVSPGSNLAHTFQFFPPMPASSSPTIIIMVITTQMGECITMKRKMIASGERWWYLWVLFTFRGRRKQHFFFISEEDFLFLLLSYVIRWSFIYCQRIRVIQNERTTGRAVRSKSGQKRGSGKRRKRAAAVNWLSFTTHERQEQKKNRNRAKDLLFSPSFFVHGVHMVSGRLVYSSFICTLRLLW